MVNVNDFCGKTDSDIIENAIKHKEADGIVIIPPRKVDVEPERDFWLLDRAILLPENTTVILQNCKLKLSDRCRDNFFRSANCGMGIEFPEKITNIHVRGEGLCVLEGADHPRATGDRTKTLHAPCPARAEDVCQMADWIPAERRTPDKLQFMDIHGHTYGTDALNPEESQYGDWRGIGVLFANAEYFSISGLKIVNQHCWGISLEACSKGRVEKIDFSVNKPRVIDGMYTNIENQDGIDIRNGCHDIVISDITGRTGDDVVALTAIAGPDYKPGGSLENTHVMHNDWTKREADIHDIVIRNVVAHSQMCFAVRLLAARDSIYNVVVDGVIDTAGAGTTVLLGDGGIYGEEYPDSIRNISVSNVVCNSNTAVKVSGYVSDSVISNIVNQKPGGSAVSVVNENYLKNVTTDNLVTVAKQ